MVAVDPPAAQTIAGAHLALKGVRGDGLDRRRAVAAVGGRKHALIMAGGRACQVRMLTGTAPAAVGGA